MVKITLLRWATSRGVAHQAAPALSRSAAFWRVRVYTDTPCASLE